MVVARKCFEHLLEGAELVAEILRQLWVVLPERQKARKKICGKRPTLC
jgi:hypothetical protein